MNKVTSFDHKLKLSLSKQEEKREWKINHDMILYLCHKILCQTNVSEISAYSVFLLTRKHEKKNFYFSCTKICSHLIILLTSFVECMYSIQNLIKNMFSYHQII